MANNKLHLVLAVSFCAVSIEQPASALNIQSLATIIASKTATLAPRVKALAAWIGGLSLAYVLARSARHSNKGAIRPCFFESGVRRIEVQNPAGKVYIRPLSRPGMNGSARLVTMHCLSVSYDMTINDGVLSIRPTLPQASKWECFWDWFLQKRPSAHILIEASRNIPVTINAQNNSIPRSRFASSFLDTLKKQRLAANTPHTVIIDGFIDGQPGQSIDVTVGQRDTIAVQNCAGDINGIYRGHFEHGVNRLGYK